MPCAVPGAAWAKKLFPHLTRNQAVEKLWEVILTTSREDETAHKQRLLAQGVRSAASDFGGDYVSSVMKIIERAVVIAKREGLISEKDHEEGAVAGAAHDAVAQITGKAMGLNVGGKISVARAEGHVAVAVFSLSAWYTSTKCVSAWATALCDL